MTTYRGVEVVKATATSKAITWTLADGRVVTVAKAGA